MDPLPAMSPRLTLHCIFFCAMLCGGSAAQAKTDLLKTQPGSVVHWSQAAITVALDPTAPSTSVGPKAARSALEQAAQAWNAVHAQQPRFEVAGQGEVSIRFCRGRWQGDTIDLGRSKFNASLRDGAVTEAVVEINECDHAFTTQDGSPVRGYDLQAVLTHELGHVLGLGHSSNPAAIMYPSGGGAKVRAPSIEDQTALALIYLGRGAGRASPAVALPREEARQEGGTSLTSWVAPAAEAQATTPPTGTISLLTLKTGTGRDVMVYTCEPTVLPPIELAPESSPRREPVRRGPRPSRKR